MAKTGSNRKKGGAFRIACCVILALMIILLGVNLWIRSSYIIVNVDGDSMESTLSSGDVVYAQNGKHAERGDIVIVDVSNNDHFVVDTIIKRLIAVEGDKIKCENNVVYLDTGNGYQEISEPYLKEGAITKNFEYTLGKGEIFVMGDNRSMSNDSSDLVVWMKEPLKQTDIIGVVLEWSLSKESSGYHSFGAIMIRGFLSGNFS